MNFLSLDKVNFIETKPQKKGSFTSCDPSVKTNWGISLMEIVPIAQDWNPKQQESGLKS